MTIEPKRYKVIIGGEVYSLVSDEAQELVEKAVAQANSLLQDIGTKANLLDARKIALLALLQTELERTRLQAMMDGLCSKEASMAQTIERMLSVVTSLQ